MKLRKRTLSIIHDAKAMVICTNCIHFAITLESGVVCLVSV